MVNLKKRKRLINRKFTMLVSLKAGRRTALGRKTQALESQ